MWDARHQFKAGKLKSDKFSHDKVPQLPSFTEELQYGDLVMVYHSASTYSVKSAGKSISGTCGEWAVTGKYD